MSCWIILYLLVCVSQVFGEPKSYIVGGTNGTISRYPHQVSLRMKNKHFCGGSIISEIWVLTAAHCVNKKRSKIVIHVGTHFQFSSRGTEYAINKVILHDFDQRTGLNDIALLNVKEHIKFNQFVQPIALGSTDPLPGTIATITGWGFTDKDGTQMQDQIKAVSLRVISIDECQKYNPIDPEMPDCLVKISNICTLSTSSEGICQGDSGGPLVVGRTQIGVVSFNAQNCALNKPDVYSSVPFYRQWIREKTGV